MKHCRHARDCKDISSSYQQKILPPHYNIAHIVLRNSIRGWYRLIASNFRDSNEALLIRCLSHEVTRRTIAAHQTAAGEPTTYLFRVLPDHLRVMTEHEIIVRSHYFAVIFGFFCNPILRRLAYLGMCTDHVCSRGKVPCTFSVKIPCNALTLAERRQMLGVVRYLACC